MDVNATEVGFNFVGRYYEALIRRPNVINQFYSTNSSMTRLDGDTAVTASSVPHIHTLVMSLNFIAIEIMTVNSLASWQGGVIVMLSGLVKIKDISRRREFVQTFFLAPQRMSYFVLNDIFHFIDDGVIFPNLVPLAAENIQTQPQASIPVADPPGRGRGGSSYQTDAPRGHFGARSLGRGSIQDTADNKGDDYPPLGRR